VQLFRAHGWVAFDTGWYGGHSPLSYSVVFPAVAARLGLGATAAISAVVASWAFDRLVRRRFGPQARWGSLDFAVGTLVEIAIGQLPFLLGLAMGLAAVLANVSKRPKLAAGLAVACALASPVTGAFLALAALVAAATAPVGQRRGPGGLGAAALVPTLVVPLAYHQLGRFPFRVWGLVALLGACVAALVVLPVRERGLRLGTVVYAAVAVVLFVAPNPVGSVVSRVGMILCLPLLACAARPGRRRWLAALTVPLLIWQWAPAVGALTSAGNDPSTHQSYFAPLLAELAKVQAGPTRLEIPFTKQHREAAWVAPVVPLARGWDRQVDMIDNAMFYDEDPVTAERYRSWLDDNGVGWVALPDVPLDYSAEPEAALLTSASALPYLHLVWQDAHWKLWRVDGSPGLITGPARLAALAPDRFSLDAAQAGSVVVRVRYTATWSVAAGEACLEPDPQGWTVVRTEQPGRVDVVARLLPFGGSAC
jgi:hypothetical protein